jgi:hypothetical protein
VLGVHSPGPGSKSPITGARPDACAYCHAPHSGLNRGLWNQKLTTQNYTTYTSDTEKNIRPQPTLGADSNKCLSCHDGTVAVGATVAYGQVTTRGPCFAGCVRQQPAVVAPVQPDLPLKDNVDLAASLAASGKTSRPHRRSEADPGKRRVLSCHNPHVQAKDLSRRIFW